MSPRPPEPIRNSGRLVTLELTTGDSVGPFAVETPWWPDVEPVVAGARRSYGLDVTVIRLIGGDAAPNTPGAHARYLAEPAGTSVDEATIDDGYEPLRPDFARPGGAIRLVAWADQELARLGRRRTGAPEQIKTWNLSCIVRLPTAGGPVWIKAVPSFMAHEPRAIEWLAAHGHGDVVPPLLAGTDGVSLMADLPGVDAWEAQQPLMLRMVDHIVALARTTTDHLDELIGLGLSDSRPAAFIPAVEALALRDETVGALEAAERRALDDLVESLPVRFDELATAGLPDTLIHGDLHRGNWRYDNASDRLWLLDWGDCGIGHPLLDMPAFLDGLAPADAGAVSAAWVKAWERGCPGSDPGHAARVIEPIAALRQALIFRTLLDGVESSERPYHEADVPRWLRRALGAARARVATGVVQ